MWTIEFNYINNCKVSVSFNFLPAGKNYFKVFSYFVWFYFWIFVIWLTFPPSPYPKSHEWPVCSPNVDTVENCLVLQDDQPIEERIDAKEKNTTNDDCKLRNIHHDRFQDIELPLVLYLDNMHYLYTMMVE